MKIDDLTPAYRSDGEMQIPVSLFGQNMRLSLSQLLDAGTDTALRLESDPSGDIMLWPGEETAVTFRVMCGTDDVTASVQSWAVRRLGQNADDDAVWDGNHLGFDGTLRLHSDDTGGSRVCRFEVTAEVATPSGTVMRVSKTI